MSIIHLRDFEPLYLLLNNIGIFDVELCCKFVGHKLAIRENVTHNVCFPILTDQASCSSITYYDDVCFKTL